MMDLISNMKFDDIEIDRFNLNFNKKFEDLSKFQFRKILLLIKYLIKYVLLLKRKKYDIVLIAHSFGPAAFIKDSLFMRIAKRYGCKVLLNAREQKFDENFYNKQPKLIRKYIDNTFINIDGIITVGRKLMSEYSKWTQNIHSDYVLDFIHNVLWNYNNESTINFYKNKFNVLYLAYYTKFKGIFTLLEAIKYIKLSGYSDINFILCGKYLSKFPNEKKEIDDYIFENGIKDLIEIKGWVEGDEKEHIFETSQLFVFPSLNDSFGLVNLEAMAHGLPIISTNVGAIPEYIENNVNGLLINPGDSKSLAESIIKLYNNNDLRKIMSTNNFVKFNKEFTYESYRQKWHDIFLKIADSKKK